MDIEQYIISRGVPPKRARQQAKLIKSASNEELLYMVVFLEGLKIGALVEREHEQRHGAKGKIK